MVWKMPETEAAPRPQGQTTLAKAVAKVKIDLKSSKLKPKQSVTAGENNNHETPPLRDPTSIPRDLLTQVRSKVDIFRYFVNVVVNDFAAAWLGNFRLAIRQECEY